MMETLGLLIAFIVLIVIITVFIRVCLRIRKGGGSLVCTSFGAVDELLDKDRKKAVKEIIEERAGKKVKEKDSSDPKDK